MIKLLIGGSPCTYWSIAQKNNRETIASGIGWDLFNNYLLAKKKFAPDLFLYENNKSAASIIKEQIQKDLCVYDGTFLSKDTNARYIEINSALVSAQNRQRFYVHNCGEVKQPSDRGLYLCDILDDDKSAIINSPVARPIGQNTLRVGSMPKPDGQLSTSQSGRVYSIYGKSITLNAGGGGMGAKTGLYAIPVNPLSSGKARCLTAGYATKGAKHILESNYSENPNKQKWDCVAVPADTETTNQPIYEVKDGFITIQKNLYPIKLNDGLYIIRKLSVAECCRLQTLPENYCRAVSATQAYKGLGNGWTAEVIIHILQHALNTVSKTEKIVVLSMYDGIGTGRYCLDKMGFANVEYYAYEIDKHAITIAQSNYPDIIQCGDAFNLRSDNWTLPAIK